MPSSAFHYPRAGYAKPQYACPPPRKQNANWWGTVLFAAAGLFPVTAIALHCAGLLPLSVSLVFIILPAFGIAFAISGMNRNLMRRVFSGWITGIFAVACYDLSRIPFVYLGWDDFIPHIASWLTGKNNHAYLIGYTWRYMGNGGGLGIVFFLLADHFRWKKYAASAGVSFGLIVFAGLLSLLIFIPQSQKLMFEVTPLAFTGGMVGHIVYGFVLGRLYGRMKTGILTVPFSFRHIPRKTFHVRSNPNG